MQASNLTFVIPPPGIIKGACNKLSCNKGCKYCVSRMTWTPDVNWPLVQSKFQQIHTAIGRYSITNLMATSKIDTLQNMPALLEVANEFQDYPFEIQTNGILALHDRAILKDLQTAKVNAIAFSIDQLEDLQKYAGMFEDVLAHDMLIRICLNVSNLINPETNFWDIFKTVKDLRTVHQLLIRKITIPNGITSGPEFDWIKTNAKEEHYANLWRQFREIVGHDRQPDFLMNFGMQAFDVERIRVTFSDYCLQNHQNTNDIRSLIAHWDGVVYTKWDEPGSWIF